MKWLKFYCLANWKSWLNFVKQRKTSTNKNSAIWKNHFFNCLVPYINNHSSDWQKQGTKLHVEAYPMQQGKQRDKRRSTSSTATTQTERSFPGHHLVLWRNEQCIDGWIKDEPDAAYLYFQQFPPAVFVGFLEPEKLKKYFVTDCDTLMKSLQAEGPSGSYSFWWAWDWWILRSLTS